MWLIGYCYDKFITSIYLCFDVHRRCLRLFYGFQPHRSPTQHVIKFSNESSIFAVAHHGLMPWTQFEKKLSFLLREQLRLYVMLLVKLSLTLRAIDFYLHELGFEFCSKNSAYYLCTSFLNNHTPLSFVSKISGA